MTIYPVLRIRVGSANGNAAVALAEQGIVVVPVHTLVNGICTCGGKPNCKAGKHPRVSWQKITYTDTVLIRKWWNQWPEANVGILTGPSQLVVVDIDPKNGGDVSFAAIKSHVAEFNEAPCVMTGGGGSHFYFAAPTGNEIKSGTGVLGDGIDLRASGGLIVAPPSLHSSGNHYKWLRDFSHSLPVYPQTLQEIAASRQSKKAKSSKVTRSRFDYNSAALIPEGERNEKLHMAARSFRYNGLDNATAFAMLQFLRKSRCENPETVTDDELASIIESAWGYAINTNLHAYIRSWRSETTPSELAFLVNLAVDQNDGITHPSEKRIIDTWGLSRSTLKRVRTSLVQRKFIDYVPGCLVPEVRPAAYTILPHDTGVKLIPITKDVKSVMGMESILGFSAVQEKPRKARLRSSVRWRLQPVDAHA